MKIAIFLGVPRNSISGYFIAVDNLQKGLRKAGHKVAFILPSYVDKRTSTYTYKSPLGMWFLPNIIESYVFKKLDDFKPDIIHNNDVGIVGVAAIKYAYDLNLPIVYTAHSEFKLFIDSFLPWYFRFWLTSLIVYWIRRYINLCDTIIAPTKSMKDYLKREKIRGNIIVQPSGLDLSDFEYCPRKFKKKEINILFIGSMVKGKNVGLLVRMMNYLRNGKYKLSIVGGGVDIERLRKLSKKLNLKNIIFYGSIVHKLVPKYYRNSDIFVSASYTESQGLVYIEAMASGLPVIALDNFGSRDILINNKTGIILHKADPKLFAKCIEKITNDQKMYEYYSRNAYEHAKNYDLSNTIPRVVKIYNKTIKNYKTEREKEGKISYFNKLIAKIHNKT